MWFSLLSGAVSLANKVAGYLRDKELIDAGKTKQANKYLQDAIGKTRRANAIRSDVANGTGGLSDDPNNRNRR